jgi:hypothetical protein
MSESGGSSRPVLVSVAVVLIIVVAVFGVIEGVLILLTRYDDAVVASGGVLVVSLAGATGILLSLLQGAIAAGVWRGSNGARIIVTAFAALGLALDVVTIAGAPTELWWTVLDAAGYAFVIVALWAGTRTAAFFRSSPAASGVGTSTAS